MLDLLSLRAKCLMQYYFLYLFCICCCCCCAKQRRNVQCEIKLILHVERAHKHFYTLLKMKEVYVKLYKKKGTRVDGGIEEEIFNGDIRTQFLRTLTKYCLKFCARMSTSLTTAT